MELRVHPQARRDVDAAFAYYMREASEATALRFVDDVEQALHLLCAHPAIGSRRHEASARLPGLRAWPLRPWLYLVFYLPQDHQLDILRVLHTARDLPATLAPNDA